MRRRGGDRWKTRGSEPFFRLIDRDGPGGCWLWLGKRDRNGYGQCQVLNQFTGRKTTTTAHRRTYELLVAPVPPGRVLDHLCRVRHCVNPDHLEPVTQRENLLRSPTIQAANAAKTHCLRGHEFDDENTIVIEMADGATRRNCRACRRLLASRR